MDPLGIDRTWAGRTTSSAEPYGEAHEGLMMRQVRAQSGWPNNWPSVETLRVDRASIRTSLGLGTGYPPSHACEELDVPPDSSVRRSPPSASATHGSFRHASDRLVEAKLSLIGQLGFQVFGAKAMSKYPYRCIGHVITSEGAVIGTGTLVGPRHVLTAAHVVSGKAKLGFRPAPWASKWDFPDDVVYWNGALNPDVAVTHCCIPSDYWPSESATVSESDLAFDHAVLVLANEPSLTELEARMFVIASGLWAMPQYGDAADPMKKAGGAAVLPQHAGRYGWLGVAAFSKSMLNLPVLVAAGAQYFGEGESIKGPPFIAKPESGWYDEIAAGFFPPSPETFGKFAMAGMPGALGLRAGIKVTSLLNTEYLPFLDDYEGMVLKIDAALSAGMSGGPVFSTTGCPGNNKPQFPTIIGVNAAAAGKVSAGQGLGAMLGEAAKIVPLG